MQERAKADALTQIPPAERATAKWEYVNEITTYKAPRRADPLTPALAHEGDPGAVFAIPRAALAHARTVAKALSEHGGAYVTVQDTDAAATNRFLRLRVTRP